MTATRHQRWALTLAAVTATAILAPAAPEKLLLAAVPTLWILAYVAYRMDVVERRMLATVEHIEAVVVEHVDQGIAEALMAIDKLGNQPPEGRWTGGLRSV